MSANEESTEALDRLHQQASALYLQGNYAEALAVWRRMLEIDPSEERAAEGARLCESLALEDGATTASGAGGTEVAPDLGIGAEVDRGLERLDEALGAGEDWMGSAADDGAMGFELGEPGDGGGARITPAPFDIPEAEGVARDVPAGLDLNTLGAALDDAGDRTDDRETSGAAAELERRAAELMADAMQLYERGQREEALAALNRLSILDEENEAAQTFAAHIRAEIEETERRKMLFGASDASAPSAGPTAAPVAVVVPEVLPDPPARRPIPRDRPPAPQAAADHGGRGTAEPLEQRRQESEAAPGPAGRRTKAPLVPQRASRVSIRWRVVGPVLAGLVVLGTAAWQLVGDDGPEAKPSPAEAPAETGTASLAGAQPKPRPATASPAVEPAAPPAPVGPSEPAGAEDLSTVLAEARAAFDAGDYKRAVLAYDRVQRLDPSNAEAEERMRVAGERFREQKKVDDERAEAFEAFQSGDYVRALRLFYRVPASGPEEQQRIQRYLRNGWYNLGVSALRNGDCKLARDQFREARQLDAEDPGVKEALALASRCLKAGLEPAEHEQVRALTPRGLEE